ncbi:ABC transporter ATP-binding protein [Brevibacterium sp. Marseille-P9724]|uniref:ABC transporter ATP-binding protein n=1 Tax=Brevibacterium sp. Marseille-P9724 TaxID=2614125 RepID=UPI00125F4433|nr:ABC transporter ATP-binding protein [Brevibacterium sp. Marseille-P9724]
MADTELPTQTTTSGNTADEAPVLEVENLSVTFPQRKSAPVEAVRGVSYSVKKGEFLAIVGESGSGKSVSSTAVMGLLPSTAQISGDIRYKGESLIGKTDHQMSQLRGSSIAMVFQDPLSALNPVHPVGKQIVEALIIHNPKLSKDDAWERAVELLRVVGIPDPENRANAFPHEYSGGMRQRAMIAIAIANDPDLIIADEPTTALDVTIQAQIMELLRKAQELTGAAIVLITHDLGVVAGYADKVAVMYAGKLIETGSIDDIFYRPRMPYTIGLLRSVPNVVTAGKERLVPLEGRPPQLNALPKGCPFAQRCPIAVEACLETEPHLEEVHGEVPAEQAVVDSEGHFAACIRADEIESGALEAHEIFPRPEPVEIVDRSGSEKVLEVTDLVKHFPLTKGAVFRRRVGTVRAVDGISFELHTGQTLGLVGESGCGKSTAVTQVMEMKKPQSGTITINGINIESASTQQRREMRKDVQIVFQNPSAALDPRLPVLDIVGEPLTAHGVAKGDREKRVGDMLELVGLDRSMASRYPHEFSGGQKQRIGIARALITDPKVLILDEPVSALDVSIQAGVINLLEDLRDRLGLSYVFVAHDLAVIRQISDIIAVMYLGRIIEYGPVGEVYENPKHPYTRALISSVPVPDPKIESQRSQVLLEGDLPAPTQEFTGCAFAARCPLYKLLDADAQAQCREVSPGLNKVGQSAAACHHTDNSGLLEKNHPAV